MLKNGLYLDRECVIEKDFGGENMRRINKEKGVIEKRNGEEERRRKRYSYKHIPFFFFLHLPTSSALQL
jgi:hypothetical protein